MFIMNQQISYKEMLMKNSDKSFEVSKKNNTFEYTRKYIRKLCTTGNINHLEKIPLKFFTEEMKKSLIKIMKDKISEIEIWKLEDQNQLFGKLEELEARIIENTTCLHYIESLS